MSSAVSGRAPPPSPRLDQAQLEPLAQQIAQTLRDVQVGREVAALRDHHAAPRAQPERRGDQLEQVDRDGIGDDHLVRLRAEQARDLRAQPLRQVDPAVLVPAGDQVLAPLPAHHVLRRSPRSPAAAARASCRPDRSPRRAARTAPATRERIGRVQSLARGAAERAHRAAPSLSIPTRNVAMIDDLTRRAASTRLLCR